MHIYEVYPDDMPAHEGHAYEVSPHEIHAHEMHAHETHAQKVWGDSPDLLPYKQ